MKSAPLRHFLIVYDHDQQAIRDLLEFADAREAIAEYAAVERQHGRGDRVEVVLIGSDSLDSVKLTHANYFDALPTSALLAGL